jgi:hypothetical protein
MKLPTVSKQPQRATKRTLRPVSEELKETEIGDGALAEAATPTMTTKQLLFKTARVKNDTIVI